MSGKKSHKRKDSTDSSSSSTLLDKLEPVEAYALLRELVKRHPELRSEIEQMGQAAIVPPSAEDLTEQVYDTVISVGLDELNERAGSHSWGYVEPSEAAHELLEESLEDLTKDMKRQLELGLEAGAEANCAGIVEGLYQARHEQSDGALGWAPDFPLEYAAHVLAEFLSHRPGPSVLAARKRFAETLIGRVPEWANALQRVVKGPVKG